MRKRARERERMRDCENKFAKREKERKKSEKRLYNHSNLVKKKKVLSRRLCIIALFSRLSVRLSFLPHADYFCIEIVPFFHPLVFSLYFLLYFPFFPVYCVKSQSYCVLRGKTAFLEAFLPTLLSSTRRACILYEINILTLLSSPFLLDDVIDKYLFKESLK